MEPLIDALRECAGGDGTNLTIDDHRGCDWPSADQATSIIEALEQRRPCIHVVDRLDVIDPEHWPLVDRALLVCLGNAVAPADLGEASMAGVSTPGEARAVDLVRIWPSSQDLPEPLPAQEGLNRLRTIYNVREDRPPDYQRTARCILGKATVLVLGGGGAKGFAHLGTLRALAESDAQPIDMIFGISIGSFIGSLYALATRSTPSAPC